MFSRCRVASKRVLSTFTIENETSIPQYHQTRIRISILLPLLLFPCDSPRLSQRRRICGGQNPRGEQADVARRVGEEEGIRIMLSDPWRDINVGPLLILSSRLNSVVLPCHAVVGCIAPKDALSTLSFSPIFVTPTNPPTSSTTSELRSAFSYSPFIFISPGYFCYSQFSFIAENYLINDLLLYAIISMCFSNFLVEFEKWRK